MLVLRYQAEDYIIVKTIQFEEVKTQTIVNGKVTLTETRGYKRLGYKTEEELVEYLVSQGYEIITNKKEVEE